DRLRVVHGGGDQLLEVDVLDVECLAHVRAARAQKCCHLLLILGAVEACFHRIRRGRDLTERQRGRKDFDQDRFHRSVRRLNAKTPPSLNEVLKLGFLGFVVLCRDNFSRGLGSAAGGGGAQLGLDRGRKNSLTAENFLLKTL